MTALILLVQVSNKLVSHFHVFIGEWCLQKQNKINIKAKFDLPSSEDGCSHFASPIGRSSSFTPSCFILQILMVQSSAQVTTYKSKGQQKKYQGSDVNSTLSNITW